MDKQAVERDVFYWLSRYLEAAKKNDRAEMQWAVEKLEALGYSAPTCSA